MRRPVGYGRSAWAAAGGWPETYYPNSISLILTYRRHIIAAAQRHQFIPETVSQSTRQQLDVLYTLAAILYQESHGYEVDQGKVLPWKNHAVDWAGAFGLRNPSLGICQIRADTTAREIEELGLLYEPGSFEHPNTTAIPYTSQDSPYDKFVRAINGDPEAIKRVDRLLDPLWAIEYAAANMELATKQPGYDQPWPSNSRPNDVLQPAEKMAGWYARGHFDVTLGEYGKGDQDIKFYLDYTYRSRVAIERLDLLGLRSQRP